MIEANSPRVNDRQTALGLQCALRGTNCLNAFPAYKNSDGASLKTRHFVPGCAINRRL